MVLKIQPYTEKVVPFYCRKSNKMNRAIFPLFGNHLSHLGSIAVDSRCDYRGEVCVRLAGKGFEGLILVWLLAEMVSLPG